MQLVDYCLVFSPLLLYALHSDRPPAQLKVHSGALSHPQPKHQPLVVPGRELGY